MFVLVCKRGQHFALFVYRYRVCKGCGKSLCGFKQNLFSNLFKPFCVVPERALFHIMSLTLHVSSVRGELSVEQCESSVRGLCQLLSALAP